MRSSAPSPIAEPPKRVVNSISLGASQSETARSSGSMGAAGAGFSRVVIPAARAARKAASVVACGISNWPTTIVGLKSRTAASATAGSVSLLAPGTMMMRLIPFASTQIGATPLEPGTVRIQRVSIPSRTKFARCEAPYASSPTALTMATGAPKRAACTAWFAPFPPKPIWKRSPTRVSPALGMTLAYEIRSIMVLPTTRIRAVLTFDASPLCRAVMPGPAHRSARTG